MVDELVGSSCMQGEFEQTKLEEMDGRRIGSSCMHADGEADKARFEE
jgi:hypothetical protein